MRLSVSKHRRNRDRNPSTGRCNSQRIGIGRMGPVVLIVEDESLTRLDAVEMAEAAGFAVVEASNADDAIRILESRNDIRIVFTDIDMPGSMDGLKLPRAIRNRWPPIQLIVT